MKIRCFLITALMFILSTSLQAETITLKKSFWSGMQYSTDGINFKKVGISGTELYNEMVGNYDAQAEMKKYKTNKTWAIITSIPGGGLPGWALGSYLGKGEWEDSYTTMVLIGVPFAIISMITESKANGHLKNAVDIYNGDAEGTNLTLSICNKVFTDNNSNQMGVLLSLHF